MAIELLAAKALEVAGEAVTEAAKELSEKVAVESMKTGTELPLNNLARDVTSQQQGISVEQLSEGREMLSAESTEDMAASNLNDKLERLPYSDSSSTESCEIPDESSEQCETSANGGDIVERGGANEELVGEQEDIEQTAEDKSAEIEADKREYVEDIKSRSPCPETIDEDAVCESDFKRISPEENAEKRMEFEEKKGELIKEWERINGREWPRYENDVYSENGHLIRKAGMRYDAHHIKPLCMGGENTAENLTPLHAEDHYDHQGVHSSDSPYSKLMKEV